MCVCASTSCTCPCKGMFSNPGPAKPPPPSSGTPQLCCFSWGTLMVKKSRFYLFYEVHEAGAEPPGLVPVALQGVHGHLRRALVAHGHHVHCVVQQGSVCLKGRGTALVAVGCCRKRWNPPCVTPCQPQGFSVHVPC